MNRNEDVRIVQITSPYDPYHPPQLPLDFSDYLSLVWRLDQSAEQPHLVEYYRQCTRAIARSFGFDDRPLGRAIRTAEPGMLYEALSNVPFRETMRMVDAAARKDAIRQLAKMRANVVSLGAYQHEWVVGWPGSGVLDAELRERIFATYFTALRGQYAYLGRLLLVIDIVLQELLLGTRAVKEVSLGTLIDRYGYPDPEDPRVRALYDGELVTP